jgi:CHAT domain-containing protein
MPNAFAALPGTEREVHDLETRSGRLDLLTGAHATEAAFKSAAPGHAWIHVATHGFVLEDSCRATSPGTRGVGGYEPLDAERSKASSESSVAIATDPWLGARALLALAGANRAREHHDENEGWLTAGEVSTLDLRDTRWVVLSACRSGVASVWGSEGVLGMRRAFHLAGVRSVIASLWDVDDDATREWMRELYSARDAGGVVASDAARRACIETLRARRSDGRSTHPFYWAAFTVSGG